MSIVEGWYYALICACKSASIPSPINDMTNKVQLIHEIALSFAPPSVTPNSLNITIPKVTNRLIHNLLRLSFSLLSLTLEQNTPTRTTESMLQDLTMTTAGKDASIMA